MYIYFYERILGSLIDDDTFALPYWNWDAPAGMALPAMFKDSTSPLYDAKRNPEHVNAYVNFMHPKDGVLIPFDPPKDIQAGPAQRPGQGKPRPHLLSGGYVSI